MNLAYVYCDLGDPTYKALVDEMVTSARAVMPGVKITQISDRNTPIYPGVDAFVADVDCRKEDICAFKGHFMAEYAMRCEEPLILCDVDLIWQKLPVFDEVLGLKAMVRHDFPSMPFNTGLIVSLPTERTRRLWGRYQETIDNLAANGMGTWYCDQIAAAIVWVREDGVEHLRMEDWAYAPTGPEDDGGKDAVTLHLKGDRKRWLQQFKRKAA